MMAKQSRASVRRQLVARVRVSASTAFAQLSPTAAWATHAQNEYAVAANITYLTASGCWSRSSISIAGAMCRRYVLTLASRGADRHQS